MTAGVQAGAIGGAAAAAAASSYSVTVVDVGGGVYRYAIGGGAGSISPNSVYKGVNINRLQSDATVSLTLYMPAVTAQSHFTRIVVQKTSGAWVSLTSAQVAAYTANDGSGNSIWEYSFLTTGGQVWTAAGTYGILFFYT